jgi:uncharacterized protein YtpQ (UPF0354 family)
MLSPRIPCFSTVRFRIFELFFGPPSEARFARLLVAALHRAGDTRQFAYNREEFRLEVSNDGALPETINLRNLYIEYCRASRDERTAWLQKTCIGFLNRMEVPTDFDDVKADLRPTLRSRTMSELMRLECDDLDAEFDFPTIAVSEHLEACLVYDMPRAMRFIRQDNLDDWGVSLYQAMEVARQNLAELPCSYAVVADRLYLFDNADAFDGSRMLVPDMIRELEVAGSPLALPITRDCLLLTGTEDYAGLCTMVALAEQSNGAPRPLCGLPHVLVGDDWRPWQPDDGHPAQADFRKLACCTSPTSMPNKSTRWRSGSRGRTSTSSWPLIRP